MASNTDQFTEMEYHVTDFPFKCVLRPNCRHYVHAESGNSRIFYSHTTDQGHVCDYSRQAASWMNGKTGFDSHQEWEISVSCTLSRLALKPTKGSNPGSKSGEDRTDNPSPWVPLLRMRGATFPLQHTPSWLKCYWSTRTCVRLLQYLFTRLDASTVMTADHNTTRHHVRKFPAMNTKARCPKKFDHCLSFFGQLRSFHHPNYRLTLFNVLNTDVTKNTLTADTPQR
jgi:hypothetical protein